MRKVLALTGQPESLIAYVTDRPGHDRRYALSSEKLMRETGWEPVMDFEAGLARTIDWYRAQHGLGGARAQRRVPRLLRTQLRQSHGGRIRPGGMRVAIEAASLALSSGGLARYTSELSLALARCFPEDEFFLVSDQPFRDASKAHRPT